VAGVRESLETSEEDERKYGPSEHGSRDDRWSMDALTVAQLVGAVA
jgi:hypothetical protein